MLDLLIYFLYIATHIHVDSRTPPIGVNGG